MCSIRIYARDTHSPKYSLGCKIGIGLGIHTNWMPSIRTQHFHRTRLPITNHKILFFQSRKCLSFFFLLQIFAVVGIGYVILFRLYFHFQSFVTVQMMLLVFARTYESCDPTNHNKYYARNSNALTNHIVLSPNSINIAIRTGGTERHM